MMKRIPKIIKELEEPLIAESPFILWAGRNAYGYDSNGPSLKKFPSRDEIYNRKDDPFSPMPEFCKAIKSAKKRINIIDEYFFRAKVEYQEQAKQYYKSILYILSSIPESVQDIRIIASSNIARDDFWKYAEETLKSTITSFNNFYERINIKINSNDRGVIQIHDRFAIIDDSLWHFGANVGGTHPNVSAASGGWSAPERDAIRFFNDFWNSLEGGRR